MKLKALMKARIVISEPWSEQSGGECEYHCQISTYEESNDILVKLNDEHEFGGICTRYLVGSLRGKLVDGLSKGRKYQVNFIATTRDRAESSNPVDTAWWRGGGAFIGEITIV